MSVDFGGFLEWFGPPTLPLTGMNFFEARVGFAFFFLEDSDLDGLSSEAFLFWPIELGSPIWLGSENGRICIELRII